MLNKDLLRVIFANIVTLLAGIVTSLIIPKILGIHDYAYYRMFTLYLTFVGFAHFGYADGILVLYGNYDYKNLPKEKFRGFTLFLGLFQLAFGCLLIGFLLFANGDDNKRLIFLFVAINLVLLNLTTYFTYICQITKDFKTVTRNIVINNIILILGTLIFLLLKVDNYVIYILLQTFVNLTLFARYIFHLKEIVFGKLPSLQSLKGEITGTFKVGVFILLGNIMGVFIMGLDRIFIERFYTLEEFAFYSFAVSLLSLVFTFITAISNFIYPYVRRMDQEKLPKMYITLHQIIASLTGLALASFFVLKVVVQNFLPHYIDALTITAILYPTIMFRAIINLVAGNFYKTLRLEKDYNKNNLIALLIALALNGVAIGLKVNIQYISFANFTSFFLWLLYTNWYFGKKLDIFLMKHNILIVLLVISFLVCTLFSWYTGLILYIIVACFLPLLFYKSDIVLLVASRRVKG
ncbi:oligosaccharide flippase family protein [Bacillus sp. 165]|uniref:lipopolysaccharide biosynthesis protein n=1 Tax=Bacillus sp. 165 TaxID=1529117 RepID=UPI001ADA450B|nr:oligosaccharide flippase family protein [Bacillus sp. 165]MBO9131517.1 oligosaccharide flippase family protein [Bacillus sp. 165]